MTISSLNSLSGQAPLTFTGLSGLSGLNTKEIVSELMSIERTPLTRLNEEREVREGEQSALRKLQSSLQELSSGASELSLPALYSSGQSVSSNEPTRVAATLTGQAAVGGYEVEVSQLASAARASFTYASPASEQTFQINGHTVKAAANESLGEFAKTLNSELEGKVWASVQGSKLVLSDRETGSAGTVEVSGAGSTLEAVAGSSVPGKNARYTVNEIAGESASNTVTEAIPGVSLALTAMTPSGSAVSVSVSAPSLDVKKVTEGVKALVAQYNTTLAAVQSALSTKPPATLAERAEQPVGLLFQDPELESLASTMRLEAYRDVSVEGLPASMSSLERIGVTGGAPTNAPSQGSIEGQLTLETATLEQALSTEPENVRKLLQAWGARFEKMIEGVAAAAGSIETRVSGDESRVSNLTRQIGTLEESLLVRQQNLEHTYAALESAVRSAESQRSWLTSQLASLSTTTTG